MTENLSKTALITGASAGIGRELAGVFAENGYDLVVVARREALLRDLAAELQERHGVQVTPLPKDLSEPAAPAEIFEWTQDNGVEVDVLVNNAGLAATAFFHETDYEEIMQIAQVNALSLTAMTHLFLGGMVRRGRGRILNVASIVSFFPTPSFAVYGATKAYVLSLSEALSQELRNTGVTVTALCPGYTETEMISAALEDTGTADLEAFIPPFVKMTPEAVAREGYKACMRGRPIHVPGLPNRFAAQWVRWQPRWLVRNTGGVLARVAKTLG